MSSSAALPVHLQSSTVSEMTPKASRHHTSPTASPQHVSPRSNGSNRDSSTNVDIEGLLRLHGDDAKKALESVMAEKANLVSQAQNSQLWKLIEKQRAQCAALAADNDRLRSDRERANSRLASVGLDAPPVKKMSSSASSVGLAMRAETQIRRTNSDREDRSKIPEHASPSERSEIRPNITFPMPNPSSGPTLAQPLLLPSPLTANTPARGESRMAFPAEVSTFMSLADSPRDARHAAQSGSSIAASPASLYSEHPGDNGYGYNPMSRAPLSNTESVPEEPEDDLGSVLPPRNASLSPKLSTDRPTIVSEAFPSEKPLQDGAGRQPHTSALRDNDLPDHIAELTRSHLPHTRLAITNSTVFPNALGREVLCFIVCVTVKLPNSPQIQWNVAKLYSAFVDLDNKIKANAGKGRKEWKSLVTPLPEGRAWKDFAPGKIDQRKRALEAYVQSLLTAPINDKSDLCEFLSTDRVKATKNGGKKEGYLTKKGKNFGGWKTRYFVLDGPVMEYYESRGGTHLGSIVVTGAQIGRQNRPSDSGDDRHLRHAFLIIEQAKKGGTRHVLCAESDSDRDNWIEVLVRHVEPEQTNSAAPQVETNPISSLLQRQRSDSRKPGRDVVITAAQPMSNLPSTNGKFGGAPSPSMINSMESKRSAQPISPSPSLPSVNSHASTSSVPMINRGPGPSQKNSPSADILSSSPPISEPTPRASKRQSLMPRPSHSAAYLSKVASEGLTIPGMERDKDRERKAKSGRFWPTFGKGPEKVQRPVFAVPLSESIAIASKANLPAIVFRCIEYLETKHAETEEGIYRLSGSSAVIKGLKDRFDVEGDVDLIKVDEHWDPHAIAGLLKTFLRELPLSLLTRDLHPRFLAVMDLIDSSARVAELSRLVSDLPPHNYALLRALTAHLILIVKNSASNKMTLRNIGIVFSPTLGIPAGIFSELVSHFGPIFDDDPEVVIVASQDALQAGAGDADETVRRKRNSQLYQAGGVDAMLGLGGRSLDPAMEDSSDGENDDVESEAHSCASSDYQPASLSTHKEASAGGQSGITK